VSRQIRERFRKNGDANPRQLPLVKDEWKAFVIAYADPTSPTFGQRIESYLAAYPHVTDSYLLRRIARR
jgi:hypothetical protein